MYYLTLNGKVNSVILPSQNQQNPIHLHSFVLGNKSKDCVFCFFATALLPPWCMKVTVGKYFQWALFNDFHRASLLTGSYSGQHQAKRALLSPVTPWSSPLAHVSSDQIGLLASSSVCSCFLENFCSSIFFLPWRHVQKKYICFFLL